MNHPQVAIKGTPMEIDNSTAHGITHESINQKRSKAIDMRYYWLRDQRRLQLFNYYWRKGELNLADYCSKHFPATSHVEQEKTHRIVDGLCHLSMLSLQNVEKLTTACLKNDSENSLRNNFRPAKVWCSL